MSKLPDRTRLADHMRRYIVRPMTSGAKRAFITLLVISFALAGLNLLFTAREVAAVRATDRAAARNAASVVQLCQASNASRAQQVTLWDHLAAVSQPPAHETAAHRRQRLAAVRVFLGYVHRVFAPRNCARRYGLPP